MGRSDHEAGLGLDDFLGHKTSGGGGSFLGNWRKDPGNVTVWLHTRARIFPIWSHGWAEVKEVEDKETKERTSQVFGRRFNCHEREVILRKQHFRDDDGNRDFPPTVCPHCLMIEAVRRMVREKKISWVDQVFLFEGDDPERTVSMTAGGIYNAFSKGKGEFTKTQIAEMRRAGIRRDEAFRENNVARLQYLFTVLADPSEGIQITTESSALGNKMKAAIRDEIRRSGEQDGNPTINPYPFEWTYNEDESFDDKYHVVALTKEQPTDEILALIRDEDPPDLKDHVAPGDCRWLRDSMEAHCVLDGGLPWDEIFGPAEEAGLMRDPEPAEDGDGDGEEDGRVPEVGRDDAEGESEGSEGESAAEEELFECDHCKGELRSSDLTCPHCGAEYDENAQLSARPCTKCKTVVQLPDGEASVICPKCATVHDVKTWVVVAPPSKAKAEEPARPRSRSAAAPASSATKAVPPSKPAAASQGKPAPASSATKREPARPSSGASKSGSGKGGSEAPSPEPGAKGKSKDKIPF